MKTLMIMTVLMITAVISSEGQCLNGDCVNGHGVFKYSDNTLYIGTFLNKKANGYGACYYANGTRYTGQWKNHTYHGAGTFYNVQGIRMSGEWVNGKLSSKEDIAAVPANFVQPKIYAIIIGVARYKTLKSLSFTDDDAYKMYSFLKSPEGGALPDEQITLLIDEDASKTQILEGLQQTCLKAGSNDVVMVYYSGHAVREAILPSDYDEATNSNLITYKELYTIINNSLAKYKICLLDACHSGGLIAHKGIDEIIPATAQAYYESFQNTAGGMAIITSSKEEESSIEDKRIRQGVFSHFWINALKGMADVNNDKIVTLKEAFDYVQKNVSDYTSDFQNPQLDGDYDPNFPLSIVP